MGTVSVGGPIEHDHSPAAPTPRGTPWKGITLEVCSKTTGELPEMSLLLHTAVLTTVIPRSRQLYVPDAGWSPVQPTWNLVQFFPAQMPHAWRWEGDVRANLIGFDSEFLRGDESEPTQLIPHDYCAVQSNLLAEIVIALESDLAQGCPYGSLYGERLGAAFAAELFSRRRAASRDYVATLGRQSVDRIDLALEYINDNLTADLSLIELARMAQVSVHHFLRLFKQRTGLPPHRYVLRRRLLWAQSLLNDPHRSIFDVAVQTGFADQSHFSATFRRFMGISPSTYRQSLHMRSSED